jgi:hypothetical protein
MKKAIKTYRQVGQPVEKCLPGKYPRAFGLQLIACVLIAVQSTAIYANDLAGEKLTLDQRLIVACYRVDVVGVVRYLRAGAKAETVFGDYPEEEEHPLEDPWSGNWFAVAESMTPLVALASAEEYPDPPKDIPRIWEDRVRVQREQDRIPKKVLQQRRADELTILYILLSHGADVDSADSRGGTALHSAVHRGKLRLVKALLKFGANPNTKHGIYIDGPGDITPLHDASNSRELMQLLLDHGADVTAKDSRGETPIDWLNQHRERDFDLVITPDGPRIRPRDKDSSIDQ